VILKKTNKKTIMIQKHNQSAPHLWSQGGRDYDFVSLNISDVLAHYATPHCQNQFY